MWIYWLKVDVWFSAQNGKIWEVDLKSLNESHAPVAAVKRGPLISFDIVLDPVFRGGLERNHKQFNVANALTKFYRKCDKKFTKCRWSLMSTKFRFGAVVSSSYVVHSSMLGFLFYFFLYINITKTTPMVNRIWCAAHVC